MTTKLQTYPKYKPSGVDWLGEVPANWTLLKNRSVVRRRRGEFNKSDDTPVLTLRIRGVRVKTDLSFGKSTDSYVGHQLVYPGDLVFTPRDFDQTPILSGVADNFGCISNLYFVLKTKPEVDGRFLNYYWWGLKYGVDYFKNFSSGMRFSFNYFQFKEIPFLKPPLETQKQIADFLDEKTKVIDELVAKKEKLIELLREKRSTLIIRAVTKGIDPNAKLKSSGIDWLGDISDGWEIRRGKFLFRYKKEPNSRYQCDHILALTLRGVINKEDYEARSLTPTDYASYQIFYQDDLVFKLIDLENFQTSRVGIVSEKGIMSPAYLRIAPVTKIKPRFFYWFYYSLYLQGIFNFLGMGVRSTLNQYDLLAQSVTLPPTQEQKQIAEFLDTETAKIDKAVMLIESQIEKLKEYRSSLIYHAVTGKIKV